jgi:hypothetical protein
LEFVRLSTKVKQNIEIRGDWGLTPKTFTTTGNLKKSDPDGYIPES